MPGPDFEKIDSYLLNNMNDIEIKAFEQRLASDEELAEVVRQRREMLAVVDAIGDIRMKDRVRQLHRTAVERDTSRSAKTTWKWAIAIVLLLSAAIFFWFFLRKPAPNELYANYYEPYSLSFGARSTETEQRLTAAGQFYLSRDYANALPIFQEILASQPGDSKARLAAGICQMELKRYDLALANFQTLVAANDPLYLEQAIWYSALARIGQNDLAAAKPLLERIAEDEGAQFQAKAKELLDEL